MLITILFLLNLQKRVYLERIRPKRDLKVLFAARPAAGCQKRQLSQHQQFHLTKTSLFTRSQDLSIYVVTTRHLTLNRRFKSNKFLATGPRKKRIYFLSTNKMAESFKARKNSQTA
jgi:hypothetical protein